MDAFDKVDDLINGIYNEVTMKDLEWADDIIAALSEALYDGEKYRLILILDEWNADAHLSPQFVTELYQSINYL